MSVYRNPIYISEVMFEGKGGAMWIEGYDYSNGSTRYSNASGLAGAQEALVELSQKLSEAVKTRDTSLQTIENIRNYLGGFLNLAGKFDRAIPFSNIMVGDPNRGKETISGNWASGWNPWTGQVFISTNYPYRQGLPHPEAQYSKSSDSGKRALNNAFLEDKVKKLQLLNATIELYNSVSQDVNSFTQSLNSAQVQLDKISSTDPASITAKAQANAIITKGLSTAKSQKWLVVAGIGIASLIILAFVGKNLFSSKA